MFDQRDLAEVQSDDFPGERLIVCRNPRLAAERLRGSVVQPAQRSPAARNKAARKRTHDDLPVLSFRSLLTELSTFTANTMRIPGSQNTFIQHPEPTPVQNRSRELLGLTLLM